MVVMAETGDASAPTLLSVASEAADVIDRLARMADGLPVGGAAGPQGRGRRARHRARGGARSVPGPAG